MALSGLQKKPNNINFLFHESCLQDYHYIIFFKQVIAHFFMYFLCVLCMSLSLVYILMGKFKDMGSRLVSVVCV